MHTRVCIHVHAHDCSAAAPARSALRALQCAQVCHQGYRSHNFADLQAEVGEQFNMTALYMRVVPLKQKRKGVLKQHYATSEFASILVPKVRGCKGLPPREQECKDMPPREYREEHQPLLLKWAILASRKRIPFKRGGEPVYGSLVPVSYRRDTPLISCHSSSFHSSWACHLAGIHPHACGGVSGWPILLGPATLIMSICSVLPGFPGRSSPNLQNISLCSAC